MKIVQDYMVGDKRIVIVEYTDEEREEMKKHELEMQNGQGFSVEETPQ